MTMPFQPQPCEPAQSCCSPAIASTGLCLSDGTPIAVLAVSECAECGAAAAPPAVSGWLNLLNGAFTPGNPPAGTEACAGQPQQFEVGQWCDIDAAGEVVAPVLVEYEYDDAGQLVGVRTLTPAGDPYTVTGTLGLCPQPTGDTQYVELCDVQGDGEVVRFLRGFTPNGDGTATPDDITLDGTAYAPTGTVQACAESAVCRDTSPTLLCDVVVTESETIFDPQNIATADGWEVVAFVPTAPGGYPAAGPLPYPAYIGANNYGQQSMGARPDLRSSNTGVVWPGYDSAIGRWILRKTFTAPEDGTAHVTATLFRADGGGRVRINGIDIGIYSEWGQPGTSGTFTAPVTAGSNVMEIEVRDDWGWNWVTGRLDIATTRSTQFLRRNVYDCVSGEVVDTIDTTLDGLPYTVTGEVGECVPLTTCCPDTPGQSVVQRELCDVQGDGSITRFLRAYVYPDGSSSPITSDTELDGVTPYVPTGTVKRCEVSGMLAPVEFCFSETATVQRPGRVYDVDLPLAQGFGIESILVDLIEFPVPVIWGVNDPNGAQFAADLRAATQARFPGATVTVTPPAITNTCGDPEIFHVRIECLDLEDDPPALVQYRYNAGRDLISNPAFVTTPPTSNPSSGPHQLRRADNGGTLNCTSTANRGWETNDINGTFEWWGYANNPPGVSSLNAGKATTPTPRATPVQEINANGAGAGQPDTIWQTFAVITAGTFNIRVVVGGRTGTEDIAIKLSTGDVNAGGAGDIINTVVSAGQVTNENGGTPGPWTTYTNSVALGPGLYTLAFTGPPVPGGASGGLFTDMRVYQDIPGQLVNFTTDDDECTVDAEVTSTTCQLWAPISVDGEIVRWHRMIDGLVLDNVAFWTQVPEPSCCTPGTAGGSTSAGNLVDSYQVCGTVDGEQVTLQRVVITTQAGGTLAEQYIGPNGVPVTPSEWTPGACPPEESEPCASTVQTVRLCDMNPDVEPNGEGLRCATPFLRHLVFDCSGVLTGTHDTTMDGVTPYTPVQVVDCDCEGGGGRTAFVEVPWSTVSVAEDPDGTVAQDFIYTVSPGNDPDTVGTIHVHVSRAAGGACGAYDIDHLVFSNSATYTITLDPVARGMSYLRVDLMDFDTFEPVGINGVRPDRLGGTAQWNGDGTRIIPTESNGVGYLYWDHPPETISYTIYNTGGGTSCSQLAFQGMSLEAGGCCDGESTAAAAGFDVESHPMCVIDNATGNVLQHIRIEVVYDAETGEETGRRYVDASTGAPVALPGGAHIDVCPGSGDGRGVVSVLEACRCDDTDGDGIGDVEYVELLAVADDGTLTTLGTYTTDLTGPYSPVVPAPCPVEGAEPLFAVQARRVQLDAGETWDAAAWPRLQSVTALAAAGTGTVVDAGGPSTLHEGESATWGISKPADYEVRGPLTITADAGGTVSVVFTVAVQA